MLVDVVMPKMGESITEGTILEWRKQVGDPIAKDEILLEIGTDKVDSEIPSPYGGTVVEILAQPNDVVAVGVPIARIETGEVVTETPPQEQVPERTGTTLTEEKPPTEAAPKTTPPPEEKRSRRFYTPVVLKIARKAGLSSTQLEMIPGTGRGGRVTKRDILAFIEAGKVTPAPPVPTPEMPTAVPSGDRAPLSHVRKLIAEHMRRSLDTAAHVYVMTEVDMTAIAEFIRRRGPEFQAREGFRLTYTPFIVAATVQALREYPEMNASLEENTVVYHRHVNIGLAVAVEQGLMVPVIPHCEELNFLGLCRKVNDLAVRTRKKQISPDELQGSTFSITNFGVFNVTMGTPIINQPNVGILGVGTVTKRPVVVEGPAGDAIGIRSMLFLSLGFDHRLIDGAGGSRFIDAVRRKLEAMDLEHLL
jgi:2-oxoglutarate dehydrogenase E2 component (dihydrolipoamide succinyltransferase)